MTNSTLFERYDPHSMGNINPNLKSFCEQAAKDVGTSTFFNDAACDIDGNRLPGLLEILAGDPYRDMGDFWRRVHQLQEGAKHE